MNPSDPTEPAGLGPDEAHLLAAAWEIRGAALCTYSNFAVGAALLDSQGRVWTGANVENASYTLGLCAERVAIFYALAHGARDFKAVVVTTGAAEPTSPCGACRQILHEFAPDAVVLSAVPDGRLLRTTVRELLPFGFDAAALAQRA